MENSEFPNLKVSPNTQVPLDCVGIVSSQVFYLRDVMEADMSSYSLTMMMEGASFKLRESLSPGKMHHAQSDLKEYCVFYT
jgi:hypothetical protein